MEKILQIEHLQKSFGGVHATNDLSFEVNRGEILGLIGPNGSGKSTCINLITGVYTPDSGSIKFKGREIKKLSIPQRAKLGMGRTFQTPKPFTGLTVFDSVFTIAMQKYNFKMAAQKAMEALDLTNLAVFRDDPCERLSIERRKWLDMARVMVTEPELIMMDECMAGLNPAEMDDSIDLVKRINEAGVTIIFVEHVMKAVVNLCQRILVLNEGQLICSGLPDAVMNDQRVISAYLGGGYHHAKN